jgi:hypothetical protein
VPGLCWTSTTTSASSPRKEAERVRLYSRPGNDLTYRFPLIVEALARLRSRSCIIDGEAVRCDDDGRPSFDRIRYRRYDASVFLCAFDLIELKATICGATRWRCAKPVDHCCYAWNTLIDQPWKIMSIARRDWAAVGHSN